MTTGRSVAFTVLGVAQPKGSMRAFTPKGWKHPIVTSSNRNLKAWESLIAGAAQGVAQGVYFTGPVTVEVIFRFPRPKSMPKKVTHHVTTPDLDKCVRALDGLTGILWRDDSQVVAISALKTYAREGTQPSTSVRVTEVLVARLDPLPVPLFDQPSVEY